jgi:hypothetical protein
MGNKRYGFNFQITIPLDLGIEKELEIVHKQYGEVVGDMIKIGIDSSWRVFAHFSGPSGNNSLLFQRMELQKKKSLSKGRALLQFQLIIHSRATTGVLRHILGTNSQQIYLADKRDKLYKIQDYIVLPPEEEVYSFEVECTLPESGHITNDIVLLNTLYHESLSRSLKITIDTSWRLLCTLCFNKTEEKHYCFQRMVLQERSTYDKGDALVKFILKVQGENVNLYEQVGIYLYEIHLQDIKDEVFVLPVLTYQLPLLQIFPDLFPSIVATESERLFLFTIRELDRKLHIAEDKYEDEFNLRLVSAMLRQLLLDNSGMIPRLAKTWECKLSYVITFTDKSKDARSMSAFPLDPTPFQYAARIVQGFDDFLSTPVINNYGELITVAETIRAVANGKGGIHNKLSPGKQRESDLLGLDEILSISGREISLKLLREIGRVTLHAVTPLVEKIMNCKPTM